ncbi:MAG TPA: hypothetical protein ENF53_00350 [Thermoprotei archaeon]|nr:hypothetical protein [Thermoprotei archaeon]
MKKKPFVVSIKNVDPILWSKFKAEASLLGIPMGEAFNQAIRLWLFKVTDVSVKDKLRKIFGEGIEVGASI